MPLDIVAGKDGVVILADTCPATPDATVHALKVLRETPTDPGGSRIAVLGEMPNLGAHADEAHLLVGRAAGTIAKPDSLILVGTEYARKIAAGAIREGFPTDKVHYFDSADDAVKIVPFIVTGDDAVFVAGAGTPSMGRIVAALGGEVSQAAPSVTVSPPPNAEVAPAPDVAAPPPPAAPSPPPPPSPVLETLPELPPVPTQVPLVVPSAPPPPPPAPVSSSSPTAAVAKPGETLTALFERERQTGFASFTDADISLAVPISQKVLNELIAFGLASSPPIDAVSDLSVRFAGNDLITVQATVEKWLFRKTVVAEFRVERYIPYWQNPEVVLTLLTSGIIELILNVVPLPPWVRVEGAKVRVHLGTLFTENNLSELNKLIREASIVVHKDVANVTLRVCVGPARIPTPREVGR